MAATLAEDRTAIVRELDTLVQQQIRTLKQQAAISDSEMCDYHERAQRISALYGRLEQVKRQDRWIAERRSLDAQLQSS